MPLNIKGGLKKIKYNDIYKFLDEIFSNSIDSFLIRKHKYKDVSNFEFDLKINFTHKDLLEDGCTFNLEAKDNGIGLGLDERRAFITKDTTYKDDLNIPGIRLCKGSGRLQYWHYFSKVEIDSHYKSGNGYKHGFLSHDDRKSHEIDMNSFKENDSHVGNSSFLLKLDAIKDKALSHIEAKGRVDALFSAKSVKDHLLTTFLHHLVTLKENLGEFKISIASTLENKNLMSGISPSDMPKIVDSESIKINENIFQIKHYKISGDNLPMEKNIIALCANSAIVIDITKQYLKSKSLENNKIDGAYHVLVIEGDYLDMNVNEHRDGYNLPARKDRVDEGSMIDNLLSLEEIYDELAPIVNKMIAPPEWSREKLISNTKEKYAISSNMLASTRTRVHFGDTEEAIATRVLKKYQENIIKDTGEIFDLSSEIEQLNPVTEEFREKLQEIAWKNAACISAVSMSNLSQLVSRRSIMLDLLSKAIDAGLNCQESRSKSGLKNQNEEVIHNLFFPMRRDSENTEDHDIWMLNEEYQYYDYIASDLPLAKYKLDDLNLYDKSIDEDIDELTKSLRKNSDEGRLKRPDIAIFGKGGSAVIVEFKSPGVSLDDHAGDLREYATLLASKSDGKIDKFYGYLIGDTCNASRLGFTRSTSNNSWFRTEELKDESGRATIGEIYMEVLYYKDILNRARTRMDVYKKKLGI